MVSTRNNSAYSPGGLECKKLKELYRNRKKKSTKKSNWKIEDLLFRLIYFALYLLTFIMIISLYMGIVAHKDFEPPSYLPFEMSCEHLLLEAVQRSRFKPVKPQKKIRSKLLNFVKKSKFTKRADEIKIFENGMN
jgi:hypothetical protein